MNGTVDTLDGERVTVTTTEEGVLMARWNVYSLRTGWRQHHVAVASVEATKGKPVVIVLANGATVKLPVATRIRCTSATLGEYEASGFWAGGS